MVATGQALEADAERRATKDLHCLLDRVPRQARRCAADGVQTVPLDDVVVDDLLVVGPGEMVPVDAQICCEHAVLDESILTGESTHLQRRAGQRVRSGAINAGGAIEVRATAAAADSTYEGIVRLVQEAAAESAPVIRLADRVAVARVAFRRGSTQWRCDGELR